MEQGQTATKTSIPLLAARIVQFVLATAVLGVAAYLVSAEFPDYWNSAPALGIATAIFTWLVVSYAFLSERVAVFKVIYNAYAVVALDLFLIIMWLSTMSLNAARAAKYFKPIDDDDFDFDLGDLGGSSSGSGKNCETIYGVKVCFKAKRDATLDMLRNSKLYGHLLIVIAVLAAIELLLFVAAVGLFALNFLKTRRNAPPAAPPVQMAPTPAVMPQNTGTVPVDAKYGYPVQTVDPAMQSPPQVYQPAPQYTQPQYGQPQYGQPQYTQQVPHTQ